MDDEERASAIRRGLLDPSETITEDGHHFSIDHTITRRDVAPTTEEQLWKQRVWESMEHGHRQSRRTVTVFFLAMCVLFGIVVALIGALHG